MKKRHGSAHRKDFNDSHKLPLDDETAKDLRKRATEGFPF